jgi:pantoate--beta-alanine ligase
MRLERRSPSVEIIRVPRIMHDTSRTHSIRGRSVGFVPTMGAIHEGHMSLVRSSKQENDITVVSVFVNTAQFAPGEDLEKYPREIESDMGLLREAGVDILFLPEEAVMYPRGFQTGVEVSDLSRKLCGAERPTHFGGVATIVAKLFNIVLPKRAYFGLKDYQQCLIIKRLVRDLDMPLEIVTCPTRREPDGLAISTRNRYLSAGERKAAAVLYDSLARAAEMIRSGEPSIRKVSEFINNALAGEPLITRVDYAGVYDPESLDELMDFSGTAASGGTAAPKDTPPSVGAAPGNTPGALIAAAIRIGGARLIDNVLV